MKKTLLKLLILSTLIYANTYNTKAENTLHSTDRHATAEYRKKHERFRLLKEGIKAVGVCFILYCLWQYISSERDLVGAKIASSIAGKSNDSEVITFVRDTDPVRERICIKGESHGILPWGKTIKHNDGYQYKIKALDDKNNKERICKRYATRKGLHKHLKLNKTEAVPEIIECYQLPPHYKDQEHFLCIMEYPSRKKSLRETILACISGLKKINEECIKYLNIEPFDMVEHCFINFDKGEDRWYHRFYNGGKHSKEKGEKKQIISLARSVLADEYWGEILELFKQKAPYAYKNYPYTYSQYLPALLSDIVPTKGDEKLIYLKEEIKKLYSTATFVADKEKKALLPILTRAGNGKFETFDSFLAELWVSEDTIKKILAYWGREMSINVPDDINNTIIDYCCERSEI